MYVYVYVSAHVSVHVHLYVYVYVYVRLMKEWWRVRVVPPCLLFFFVPRVAKKSGNQFRILGTFYCQI